MTKLKAIKEEMKNSIIAKNYNEKIRNGFMVTLIGKPNVGKSSLINYLSKRNVSIVTDEPGTTRDVLEVSLDFGGLPVYLSDTAGIRNSKSKIEKIGIAKAIKKANKSDIILILSDKNDFIIPSIDNSKKVFYINTKADLKVEKLGEGYFISIKTGQGIKDLIDQIVQHLYSISPKENNCLTRERHVQCVNKAILAFDRSSKLDINNDPELLSEELRSAASAIGSITNVIDVEEVLDDIFSSFCIGK
jgi:tRNA modification GTPase